MKRTKSKARVQLFFVRLSQLFIGVMIIWLLLRLALGDIIWWVALITTYPFLLTFPALLLAIILAVMKKRWLSLGLVALLVINFIWSWGPLFGPNQSYAGNGRSFTVMTYNVKFNNEHEDDMIEAIRQADADIVGLQEILLRHTERLGAEFEEQYPYKLFTQPEFLTDVVIMSKFPVIEAKPFQLMPRMMSMHVVLDVEGQPLHVIALHLTPNQLGSLEGQSLRSRIRERFTIRSNEITELIFELQTIEDPVLILCDCNFAETSQVYGRLHEHLNEVHRAIGWGFGKSNGDPLAYQRVDYIWFSDGLAPQSVRFEDPAASDHKPIFATFQFE